MSRFGYPVAHKSYFPTIREESFDVYTGQVGDIENFGYVINHPVIANKDTLEPKDKRMDLQQMWCDTP